jgi:alpha/beta superfamily hydrolase
MVDVAEHTVCSPDISGGVLEARLFWPRALDTPRSAPVSAVAAAAGGRCVLVVHQYSVMGGSQELMRGIARSFALHHGVTACTLNLRGVGGSSGMPSLTGSSEVADVAAVGAWLQQAGFTHCLLVCSSAGGPIGGSALDRVPAFTGCAARCTACSSASPP